MCYEFITYFALALQRIVQKQCHASIFSRTLLCTKVIITHTNQVIVGGVPNIDQKVL